MKLSKLEDEIAELFREPEFDVETEYVTSDNSRVDLAVHQEGNPLLAVEFEESYKWMRARGLYDSVKADREGFDYLAIVYPFDQRGLSNCWIWDFIESDMDVNAEIVKPGSIADLRHKVRGETKKMESD